MRIGILCYPTVGGSGIMACRVAGELAAQEHEVHVIAADRPVRLLEGPTLRFHKVEVGDYALFCGTDYSLPLAARTAQLCRQEGIELLHAHYAIPHAVAALNARSILSEGGERPPALVTTLHGTDVTLLGHDLSYSPLIRLALDRSDAVTAVSGSLKEQTESLFPGLKTPIEVVENFLGPEAFEPRSGKGPEGLRQELGLAQGELLAVHASNLRRVKRLDLVLDAVASCAHRDSLRLLVLAGADSSNLQTMIAERGLESRVQVRKNEPVGPYLEAADFGLYASDQESFGLAVLETMAVGRPVVATSAGGLPEVIGEGGLLSPPGDLAALTRSVDRLCSDEELRARLGNLARQRARTRFPLKRALDGYLAVYERALANRRKPRSVT